MCKEYTNIKLLLLVSDVVFKDIAITRRKKYLQNKMQNFPREGLEQRNKNKWGLEQMGVGVW